MAVKRSGYDVARYVLPSHHNQSADGSVVLATIIISPTIPGVSGVVEVVVVVEIGEVKFQ
jgi:hypothetical protein